VVLLAIGVGFARNYVTHVNPKENGFTLQECNFVKQPFPLQSKLSHVLLVGGTSGIGLALAQQLVKNGVRVTAVGRSEPNLTSTLARFVKADLSSMKEARRLGKLFRDDDFDVLFFTIGTTVMRYETTSEGIEKDLAVSYLNRHVLLFSLLNNGLGSKTQSTKNRPRIFLVGAPGFFAAPEIEDINWEKGYEGININPHMNAHVFNEAIVHYISFKYPNVSAFGLSPGLVASGGATGAFTSNPVLQQYIAYVMDSLFQPIDHYAAQVLLPLLVTPELSSGQLFNSKGNEIKPNPWLAENLELRSAQLVDLNDQVLKRHKLDE